MRPLAKHSGELVGTWPLSYAARLGSSVRSKGIYLEVRAHLPVAARKCLAVRAGEISLRMPENASSEFAAASAVVSKALEGIGSLPLLPREIEDILGISSTERRRWLADGRLASAGTRTVRLRGRAKKITFHVFDPRMVEDLLDRSAVDGWRADDAERAAENRRQGAWKAKLTRSNQAGAGVARRAEDTGDDERFKLRGWREFERDGLLR